MDNSNLLKFLSSVEAVTELVSIHQKVIAAQSRSIQSLNMQVRDLTKRIRSLESAND